MSGKVARPGLRSNLARRSILPGRERPVYGMIVTGIDADGRTIARHRTGPSRESLLSATEGMVRVLSISNPETIYRDLQGTRSSLASTSTGSGDQASAAYPVVPEPYLLSTAGLRHLWPVKQS